MWPAAASGRPPLPTGGAALKKRRPGGGKRPRPRRPGQRPGRGGPRQRRVRPGRAERSRRAVERIEAILARGRGRARDSFDKRPLERPPAPRFVSVDGYGPLFDRLAQQDFAYLTSLDFAVDPDVLRLLLPQSVLGRAQNGHGWFQDEGGRPLQFVDATFDRVLTALERGDPRLRGERVRRQRDALVQRTLRHVLERPPGPRLPLEDAAGPLLGVEFLRGGDVAAEPFLRGMILAGHMDDWDRRRQAMSLFPQTFGGGPLTIGGGEIHVVDRRRLRLTGITDPGRVEFSDADLRRLRELEVIVGDDGRDGPRCFPVHDQAYFRRRLAEGVSDDLALIYVGARWGRDAMLGAFVMDAIDTYDKAVWCVVEGGWDGHLARRLLAEVRREDGGPLVGDREILELIRFAAKNNEPFCPLSSSHRRLVQREDGCRHPTVLHHWRFLEGKPLDDIRLGYGRLPAPEFYRTAWARLQEVGLAAPPPRFRERPGRGRGR